MNPDIKYTICIFAIDKGARANDVPGLHREQRHLCSVSWDESGNWKDLGPIPDISLESLTEKVEGENKGCLSPLFPEFGWRRA
jgi:hypothetical protein